MAEVFGYEMCTKVQAQAISVCLTGVDTLAKAKTGTGKTIGFMIPAIEKVGTEEAQCTLASCLWHTSTLSRAVVAYPLTRICVLQLHPACAAAA